MKKEKIFYAPSTGGFYDTQIHSPNQIPSDAVEISKAQHASLHAGRANGRHIVMFSGRPVLEGKPTTPPPVAPPSIDDRRQSMHDRLDTDLDLYIHKHFAALILAHDKSAFERWLDDIVTVYYEQRLQAIDQAADPEKVKWDFSVCDREGVSGTKINTILKRRHAEKLK